MNKLLATLSIAALLVFNPAGAGAQEVVTVNGVEATRVVIAPPQTDLAKIIKQGLRGVYADARSSTQAFKDAQRLYYFYGARGFAPLWLTEKSDGSVAFSPSADKIVAVFKNAALVGLRPSDYLTDAIDLNKARTDPADLAALETAFSGAVMRYANHVHSGRIDPQRVSRSITLSPDKLDTSELLPRLAAASDPASVLADLEPVHREYRALKAALASFHDGSRVAPVVVGDGKLLKAGMLDERVPLLRERLGLSLMPGGEAELYDDAVVAAVEAFQLEMGLYDDGVVGPATVAALNGGDAVSEADIVANLERWRWMPRDLGRFNVFVNIPEFRLSVNDGGHETYTTRVVVGKPTNQTPVFSDEIENIVVNPYWNVPVSIATNEIGPILTENPDYIRRNNMEVLSDGHVVDASQVDWASANVRNFRIRQRPGVGNALGNIKFLFPNQHSVYLHDTPSKSLFGRSSRAFSHGCVRVQDPMAFAGALLRHETHINVAMIESMVGGNEQWLNVDHHVPVHLAYFTLRAAPDGSLHAFADVYGQNKKLMDLMAAE